MSQLDVERAQQLEKKYDTALQVRPVGPWVRRFVFVVSITFAFYHYLGAGIGVPVNYWHMGIHLSGVLLLVFIGFPAMGGVSARTRHPLSWWRYGNVPVYDWLFALVGVATALYVGLTWHGIDTEIFGVKLFLLDQSLRRDDPALSDIVAGSLLILVLPSLLQASPRPMRFDHVSIEEGLSQSVVNCMLQDRTGFLWFGTQSGLNRYDGYDFTIYRHDPQDPASLANDWILAAR